MSLCFIHTHISRGGGLDTTLIWLFSRLSFLGIKDLELAQVCPDPNWEKRNQHGSTPAVSQGAPLTFLRQLWGEKRFFWGEVGGQAADPVAPSS